MTAYGKKKGTGRHTGLRRNRNKGGCKKDGPGHGKGGHQGGGKNRKG